MFCASPRGNEGARKRNPSFPAAAGGSHKVPLTQQSWGTELCRAELAAVLVCLHVKLINQKIIKHPGHTCVR